MGQRREEQQRPAGPGPEGGGESLSRGGRHRAAGTSLWRQPRVWAVAGAALVLTLALSGLIFALRRADSADTARGTTVEKVVDHMAELVGQTVTVSGEVEDVVNSRAFTLSSEDLFDEPLLVVSASGPLPVPTPLLLVNPASDPATRFGSIEGSPEPLIDEDSLVRVTGTLVVFRLAEVERELGVDLEDDLLGEWEGARAIIATNVAPAADVGRGPTR